MDIEQFISSWKQSGGSERANFQTFANELTEVLGVPKPERATETGQTDSYRFERPVTFIHTDSQTRGFIDLYRAGHAACRRMGDDSMLPIRKQAYGNAVTDVVIWVHQ